MWFFYIDQQRQHITVYIYIHTYIHTEHRMGEGEMRKKCAHTHTHTQLGRNGEMQPLEYKHQEDEGIWGCICLIATAEGKGMGGKLCRERALKTAGSQHEEMVMHSLKILTVKVGEFPIFSFCSFPPASLHAHAHCCPSPAASKSRFIS